MNINTIVTIFQRNFHIEMHKTTVDLTTSASASLSDKNVSVLVNLYLMASNGHCLMASVA